jgi:hypothetical protein
VKFFDRTVSRDGQRLFWERAHVDGLPFRGMMPPLLTEDEFAERSVRVADARNGFFDTADEEQNRAYLQIVDACVNGWFQCLFIERFWNNTTKHYIEWVEFYLEDGTRTPFRAALTTEVKSRGAAGFPGYFAPPAPTETGGSRSQ